VSFLLDTNIMSVHLRRPRGLTHRFTQHSGQLYTTIVNLAELYGWAFRAPDPTQRIDAITQLLDHEVSVVPYEIQSAKIFGRLKVQLGTQGITVNPMDLLIASAALTYDLTLVTNNIKHFERIPNLRIQDWLAE
jgi:tRNA(fMet)-specific endonuclease VapC